MKAARYYGAATVVSFYISALSCEQTLKDVENMYSLRRSFKDCSGWIFRDGKYVDLTDGTYLVFSFAAFDGVFLIHNVTALS